MSLAAEAEVVLVADLAPAAEADAETAAAVDLEWVAEQDRDHLVLDLP